MYNLGPITGEDTSLNKFLLLPLPFFLKILLQVKINVCFSVRELSLVPSSSLNMKCREIRMC